MANLLKLRSLVWVVPLTNAGANFIVVMLDFTFWRRLTRSETDAPLIATAAESWHIPASFAVPFALGVGQIFPAVFVYYFQNRPGWMDLAKRRLLSMPLMQACVAMTGWIIGYSLFLGTVKYHGASFPDRLLILGLQDSIVHALFCFVVIYYSLESLNRRFYIPILFPEGHLSGVKGVWNLSLGMRFFIFYIAVCIFPMITVYTVFTVRMSGYEQIRSPMEVLFAVMLLSGSFLTILFARSYGKPLSEMKSTAEKIRAGKYESRIQVLSTDEVGMLGETINEMSRGLKERDFIKETFGKVVDPAVRDYLLSGNIALGGEMRQATVLFSDIRGFTGLSESTAPDRVVYILNRYFDKISECIVREKGLVNKYIGDAVLAVFGAPMDLPDHPQRALNAALEMRRARNELNIHLQAEGFKALHSGIGIHTGAVLAGNIGSETRMEYTVIGDAVNLASRIEGLTKDLGREILISGATRNLLTGGVVVPEFLRNVQVRGKQEAIDIYAIA